MHKFIWRWLWAVLAAVVVSSGPTAALGQDYLPTYRLADSISPQTVASPAQLTSTNDYLARFESRLTALESKLADEPDDGWEDTHGQKWTHKWGGRVQGDYVMFAEEPAGRSQENYFEFRRLRLYSSGTGYGVYDYKLQLEFEPEVGRVSIKDIWLGIDEIPVLGYVRMGHFYAPFSLEMLTSSKYVTFLERAIPTEFQFAPGRGVGIAAFNHTADKNITWGYGVYFDDISEVAKERVDDNQGTTVAGRVT